MVRAEKKLEKMRRNPQGWRIEDLEGTARRFGVHIRNPRGSHVVFSHPEVGMTLSVPAHRPVKPVYVRNFLELLDAVSNAED